MTRDEILNSLFPGGHEITLEDGILTGHADLTHGRATVIGIADGKPLGVEGAHRLAGAVIAAIRNGNQAPILLLIDSGSQRMRRRDELLGLNEYLAHLAKSLLLADIKGHPTIAIIHGHSAAGAFIATALAARVLVALPGANPTVMDLPSVARVTTLPLDLLQALAKSTPVFAPGLENMVATGAIHHVFDPDRPLDGQLRAILDDLPREDARDRLGSERGGRIKAGPVAGRVARALHDG